MMTRAWFLCGGLLVAGCARALPQPAHVQHDNQHTVQAVDLCSALETIKAGERRPITIRGIYVVGPEHQLLYDPNEPACRLDVQPVTWVELAAAVQSEELDRALGVRRQFGETRRAYATFTGELYGPGDVNPDDPSVPVALAFANRTRNRRYGHLNGYRTKLAVTGVSDVASVPQTTPWPPHRSIPSTPVVEHAGMPRYPELAWNVGITGDVVLEVTVAGGQVSKVEVRSGDRMLSGEAVRNVQTWTFAPDANTTFTTTFTFALERRQTGASRAPRIELQPPFVVRITAASNDW